MDILIDGNDGNLNPQKFGVVHRAEDGTVTWNFVGKFAHINMMQEAMRHTLCVPVPTRDTVRYVAPDDPDWFYALPLGLCGTLMWALPVAADMAEWEKIAKEKFGYVKRN